MYIYIGRYKYHHVIKVNINYTVILEYVEMCIVEKD